MKKKFKMNGLQFWRTERDLSQVELSLASGVPRHVIQWHESSTRKPSLEYQKKLAETLGVSIEKLFMVDNEEG